MKPRHQQSGPEPEADGAHSGMRPKRHRVDPRLDEIADEARAGRITRDEAFDRIEKVLLERFGQDLVPEAQIALGGTLRKLRNDPRVMAALRGVELAEDKDE